MLFIYHLYYKFSFAFLKIELCAVMGVVYSAKLQFEAVNVISEHLIAR